MDLLTAVNRILPALGEHPVTSITSRNPTLAIILPKIDNKLDDTLTPGYWFNTFKTTLYPDSEKVIAIPADTLSFVPTWVDAIQRGMRLFDPVTQTYLWSSPVEGVRITRVPFDELPESAASYVFYSALVICYVQDLGMESAVQLWQAEAAGAERRLMSEHLRNKKYSTTRSPRYARLRHAMRA